VGEGFLGGIVVITKQLAIRLPVDLLARIDERAGRLTMELDGLVSSVTRSDVIREALGRAFPPPGGWDPGMGHHHPEDLAPTPVFRVGQIVGVVSRSREAFGRYGRIRMLPDPSHRLRDDEPGDTPKEMALRRARERDMQTCYTVDIPGRGPQQYAPDELAARAAQKPVWSFPYSMWEVHKVQGPGCADPLTPEVWNMDYDEPCLRCGVSLDRHADDPTWGPTAHLYGEGSW
jgi:hypothetical protein